MDLNASPTDTAAPKSSNPDDAPAGYRIERLDTTGEPHWQAYVERHPEASNYHDLRWRDVVRSVFGHDTPYLLARDAHARVLGVLPLVQLRSRLFGNFLVSMPYFNYGGALADDAAVAEALMRAAGGMASERGASHVEFRDGPRARVGWPARDDKVAMLLELPDSEEALWKQLGSKVRAQVKRPLREPVAVTVGAGAAELDGFYTVFSRNMRDLGTPVYPKRLFREIVERLDQRAFIVVVQFRGVPVAAAFLTGWRQGLEIPWASSLREYNRYGVNMLLYWEVLKQAVQRGYRTFDFGRSTKDAGTYRFKRQWGAQPQPLHWHYWIADGGEPPALNPDNPKYRHAIRIWQRLPLPIANLLGPHIVRNLP